MIGESQCVDGKGEVEIEREFLSMKMWSSNTEALADSYLDEKLYLLIRKAGNQQELCKLSLSCRLCVFLLLNTQMYFFVC